MENASVQEVNEIVATIEEIQEVVNEVNWQVV